MGKLKNIPFNFKNEVINNATVLTLSGVVGTMYPWESEDEVINERRIRNALSGVEGDILIRINSPGGDVFEGVSICNYLKSLDNHITVEVTGIAASAASIIAMGADKIVMDLGTTMMIHKAATGTYGNDDEHMKSVEALRSINKSIRNIYTDKTKITGDEMMEMLTKETWFTAEEAVESGFADAIGNLVKEEAKEESKEKPSNLLVGDEIRIKNIVSECLEETLINFKNSFINKEKEAESETEEQPKTNLLNQFLGGI